MANQTRRQQIEDMLRSEPDDPFLRYALAMEHASAGDHAQAITLLQALIADSPTYIAAYLQCGQLLAREQRVAEAQRVLRTGIVMAQKTGDGHAAGEMEGLLESLATEQA
jgi:predicted Zn-dependent protease